MRGVGGGYETVRGVVGGRHDYLGDITCTSRGPDFTHYIFQHIPVILNFVHRVYMCLSLATTMGAYQLSIPGIAHQIGECAENEGVTPLQRTWGLLMVGVFEKNV